MIKSEIEVFFELDEGKTFAEKLESLERELKLAKRPYQIAYKKGVAKAKKDFNNESNLMWINNRYQELLKEKIKGIKNDEKVKKILLDIETLMAEKENAKKEFIRQMKGNSDWTMLVTRKVTPKVLEILEKNPNGVTEKSTAKEILGEHFETLSDLQKCNRYCMVFYYMEKLGWIARKGSGRPYEPKTSYLTELGKNQLDNFRRRKIFDYSLQ